MLFWQMFAVYLAAVNLAAFAAFGADKYKAVRHRWRIPETTLLGLSLIGGTAGGLMGMRLFHHKTRKKRFAIGLPLMLAAHILLLIYLFVVR